MIVHVNGQRAHAATGGGPMDSADPVILLIHGAGMDGTIWQLQTRYLAYRNYRAVAIDLPGHGRSEGEALTSVESMADWVAAFAVAGGFGTVHVVGHSMGSFVALELASRYADVIGSITLCGTATSMPVHPDLLAKAADDLHGAAALMADWGHARPAHVGLNPTPGLWMMGGARALVENSKPGVLAVDFRACMAYENAKVAAATTRCPVTVVIGLGDKMTPPKAGRTLAAAFPSATVIELEDTGHSMMTENPRAVRAAIVAAVMSVTVGQS